MRARARVCVSFQPWDRAADGNGVSLLNLGLSLFPPVMMRQIILITTALEVPMNGCYADYRR